jgi:hypothetical protein
MTAHEREGAAAAGTLASLRQALAGTGGRRRLDILLDQPDPARAVQALPADELYHAVQDVGLADAADVVQLASPEQFRAFVDLDAWRGGEIEPVRLLPWLRAARGATSGAGREAELAAWREKLAGLDSEVVSLLLRTALRIHDLEEEPDPALEGDRCLRTVEGRFVVEFLPEGADYVALRRLVDDLYEQDPFLAGRILSAVRWELPSDLEEGARRWRDGRLADLGYPELEEALSWFARPAPRPAGARPGLPDRPPGFWLASFRATTLLDRAAAALPPEATARFEGELVTAANAAIVADRVDPSDPDAVRSAVESARTLLELGLASLSGGDVDAAASALASTPLKVIFQQGFGRLLELRWKADALVREDAAAGPGPALDSPLGEAVRAVRRRRPRYFPGVEAPRGEWGSPASGAFQERPFRSAEDVRRTEAALADADALLALGRSLGLAPPAGSSPPTLATLYLTALANERLGRPFAPRPLPRADLPAAARALADVGDPRLAAVGAAGELLREMARNRAEELAPARAGATAPPGAIAALLLDE